MFIPFKGHLDRRYVIATIYRVGAKASVPKFKPKKGSGGASSWSLVSIVIEMND